MRVTSRAELEAALRKADDIIVEGDSSLLDYAVSMAGAAPREAASATLRPPGAMEREAHIARMSRAPRLWPWVAGAIAFAAAAGAALLLEHFTRVGRSPASAPAFGAAILAWPAIAVLFVLALYIVVRRSSRLDAGHAWQVTERSGGRAVLTRTRVPSR